MDTTNQDGLQYKYVTACSLDQRVSDTHYFISWFCMIGATQQSGWISNK